MGGTRSPVQPPNLNVRKQIFPESFKLCFDDAKCKISKNVADCAKKYRSSKTKNIWGAKTLNIYRFYHNDLFRGNPNEALRKRNQNCLKLFFGGEAVKEIVCRQAVSNC